MRKKLRALVIDILGVLMLIGAVLFGWLPGPGGVPLLLGGLGLLSINHEWARKLLQEVKNKGNSLYDIFFPNNAFIHWLYDLLGVGIAVAAIYIISLETRNFIQTIAIAVVFVSVGLLATNRRRIEKIGRFVNKKRGNK